ncbi:transmembrane adaptor Erv26-domain-containing protein [Gautieria morchelliformis]|nr:transmembrane adaptor Erv26-domain-containing protein [Gautieria morchelliformis]
MVTILHTLSYGIIAVVFVFVVLSLASGLLWLAEVIEEHSKAAKTVGKRIIYAVIAVHILLYAVDSNLPLSNTLFSIGCHLVFLLNFRTFPIISLTSWYFIASCLLVVANHFLWFFYFQDITEAAKKRERRWRHPMEPVPHVPTFLDIATFFGICIWLVPLFLFLSLTANENALPTTRDEYNAATPSNKAPNDLNSSLGKSQRSSLFVSLWSMTLSLVPLRSVSRGRMRKNSDGLIAPRSKSRPPSPLYPASPPLSNFLRSTSPGMPSSTFMPPKSPLHSPVGSPTSTSFDSGSWVPVDRESRPPTRPSTPGGPSHLSDETSGTRKRVNLQSPPLRRTSSHTP